MQTLNRFLIESSIHMPLYNIIQFIITPAKELSRKINIAGLEDILGEAEATNVQGEEQKKLDVYANDEFIKSLNECTHCAAMISEETEVIIPTQYPNAEYIVAFDPVDGSSNIDVNVSIGTIFSVFKRKSTSGPVTEDDCLQAGSNQLAAGYIIYGSSTILVMTTGQGVHSFTLEPHVGKFYLSDTNIKTPLDGNIYSLNEGNYIKFPEGVKKYLKYCQENDKETNRPYSSRYIGSMVADFHRNLKKGGIFIYPNTEKDPNGKLRILYECNPMSFLIEQAGGKASNGSQRMLEVVPTSIHQRTPIFVGSTNMVNKATSFMEQFGTKTS
ncbi:MAG: class 1 fructose-bisphosphatase [Bacteroidetes bacterium]|nr:class 1 fructose-bisphosphatase [Bacteroidota bacterium]